MRRLVTVLMVVLNEASTLVEAAGSVLAQTHDDLELLLIDGGSTDGTRAVAEELQSRDHRVRVLANPGVTIPAGLNVGLTHAKGCYVARLDGHSFWSDDAIERSLEILAEDDSIAAVGGRRVGDGVDGWGASIAAALSSRIGVGDSLYHYGTERRDTDHATCGLYRRSVADAVGGWDESIPVNEDVDFDHRVRMLGNRIVFEPTIETRWRVQPSLSRLFRQYRRYGRGKGKMVLKNGVSAVRKRHLAPPTLVVVLLTAPILGLRLRSILPMLAPLAYAAAVTAGSMRTCWSLGEARAWRMALSIHAMHVGWGIGFIEGAVLRIEAQRSSNPYRALGADR